MIEWTWFDTLGAVSVVVLTVAFIVYVERNPRY